MTLASNQPGYVLDGADWELLPGFYEATVTMASNIATEVEMWDSTTNTLLSRRTVPATNGDEAIQSVAQVTDGRSSERSSRGGVLSRSSLAVHLARPTASRCGCGRRAAVRSGFTTWRYSPTDRESERRPPGVHPSIRCIDQLVMINWPFTTPAVISMR